MEKRAILVAVLIAGLLLLYQILFPPPPLPPPSQEPPAERKEPAPAKVPVPVPPPVQMTRASQALPRVVTVETPLYRARVGTDGGRVLEWVLRYRGDKPMAVPGQLGSRGVSLLRPQRDPEPLAFETASDRLTLDANRTQGELILASQDSYGIRIAETLKFEAQSYRIEIRVRLENRHSVPQGVEVLLPWFTQARWPEGEAEKFPGQRPMRIVVSNDPAGVAIEEVRDATADGEWIGLESDWYITALIPRSPGFKLVTTKTSAGQVEVTLKVTPPVLAPGQSWEGQAWVYIGPKEYDRLKALGVGLENAIDFGGFPLPKRYGGLPMKWLAIPILWLMNSFYHYVPNYGVAIIFLTVITKILFYPLTLKSMASMKAMQATQPQVNALRAKYKNDPQRLQRETLELYRKHRINPMGGCLPMVIQIPIFYALYLVFSLSVELQNAAFLCFGQLFGVELWICDLARHDPTYVLPILMGGSMFIQQKMTPVVGDPRQAKIMLFMPVIFTFMFLNLPSGLVLYWFVSNGLQILQQYYMDRSGKPLKGESKGAKEARRA